MKAELKQQWLTALRGDEYVQGTGNLKISDGTHTHHCCLGVLREVAGLEWCAGDAGEEDDFRVYHPPKQFVNNGWLCAAEAMALGLDVDLARDLALLNDGVGHRMQHTFAEIADVIEERVLVD